MTIQYETLHPCDNHRHHRMLKMQSSINPCQILMSSQIEEDIICTYMYLEFCVIPDFLYANYMLPS